LTIAIGKATDDFEYSDHFFAEDEGAVFQQQEVGPLPQICYH